MKPFYFDEVFGINENLAQPKGVILAEKIPVVIMDDVLRDPKGAREIAGNSPAANWGYPPETRNFIDYYDCRLRFPVFPPSGLIALAQHTIQTCYRIAVEPQQNSIDVNWFMQIARRKPADHACPHHDLFVPGKRTFTCLLYLNSPEECSGGTSFFKFKSTQSLVADPAFDAVLASDERLRKSELNYWPPHPEEYWETVGSVPMGTGRMVVFPAEYFHAAHHPIDSFFDFPRLTLAFWMIG